MHPFAVGITVIVAITGAVPLLMAVKLGISPVPVAARPIDGVLLDQVKVVPATGLPTVIAEALAPLQYVALPMGFTAGVGYTVIENEDDVPVHPFAKGVMSMFAISMAVPGFVDVKDGIFPVPAAARPMDGRLLVQAKVLPATGLPKITAEVTVPLQYIALLTWFTVAVGLTVIVNTRFVPVHPFAVGVTVIVATVGAGPGLVAVNDGIFPVPLAARPTEGLLFDQAKVVPATGLPIVTTEVVAPLQYAIFPIGFTTGVGYTVIVNVDGVPMQPFADGVMVIVAITVEKPGFVAV